MREYVKTFKRRWFLYCLPPLLLAAGAGYLEVSKPKTYKSSASLWIDNGPTSGSSLVSTSGTGPSTFEQTLLNELLATRSFDLAVGQGSTLATSVVGATEQAKESAVVAAVTGGAGSTIAGPQVMTLTFTGSSPEVAQSALHAIIAQLQSSTTSFGQAYGRNSTGYYKAQLTTAQKAQNTAKAALALYRLNHRHATAANSAAYAALSSAVSTANAQVTAATQSLQASQTQARVGVMGATIDVVDPPLLPTAPLNGKKKAAELAVAGLLGGALLSLLLVVAFTKSEDDRAEQQMAALVIGSTSSAQLGLGLRSPADGGRGLAAGSEVDDGSYDASVVRGANLQLATEDAEVTEPDDGGPAPSDETEKRKRAFGRFRDERELQ